MDEPRHDQTEPQDGAPVAPRRTRRQFLRDATFSAATLSAIGLLAACGGEAPATATSAPSTSQPTPAGAAPTSRPAGAPTTAAPATTAAATTAPAPAARQGGEITYALATRFDTLDPNVSTFSVVMRMAFHMFDQLAREPKPGEFVPGLAEKWEINPAADEYTFRLRRDVKFHDGTPLTADAVKFTFDRIVDPNLKSQAAFSAIGPYASSTVVDPYTVTVKFKSPYAPFLDSVSHPPLSIVSPEAVRKFGADFGNNPVGSGPFKFESYRTDNVVRMVKNPDYNWAPSVYKHQGAPYLDAINWRIINEPSTRMAALKSGEVQFAEDVPTQDYADIKGNQALQLLEGVMAGSGYSMMINVTKPPTDDVKVRQAMAWGVDRVAMNRVVWQGLFQPACGPLTSVTFGYAASTCELSRHDPQRAAALLDEAGWRSSGGTTRRKDGQELSVALYYRSDNPTNVAMATFLQASYQSLGIKVELQGLAQAGYFNAVRAGEHNMQFWWGPATDPDVLRQYFFSANAEGGTNRSRYKNAEMDKLINDAAGTTDQAKRRDLYAQIQTKALNEGVMVFFSDSKNIFAYQKAKFSDVSLDWSSTYPLFYDASTSR